MAITIRFLLSGHYSLPDMVCVVCDQDHDFRIEGFSGLRIGGPAECVLNSRIYSAHAGNLEVVMEMRQKPVVPTINAEQLFY